VRVYLLILLSFLLSCQSNSWRTPSSDEKIIDIVFDLDWTLISKVEENYRGQKGVIVVGDELYRVHDWAREIVTAFHNNPRYRVSFFSGGPALRNMNVLSQVKLIDGSGKSFSEIAYKKLHRHDITEVEPGPEIENPRPGDRWKKDLRKVNSDTKRVILIDDDFRHALDSNQRKNILWTGKGLFHYESSTDLSAGKIEKPFNEFVPSSVQEWSLQRNKLALVYGIIEESASELDRDSSQLSRLIQQRVEDAGIEKNVLSARGRELFYLGSSKLKKLNRRAQRVAVDQRCFDLLGPLL
tara:strand:+ start:59159 stop:60049 length:891 start_codon:yes stop_codon:yes gene_type:complete